MRICLAAVGSRGDVQPVLALAQALRRRGHDSLVCAPPNFEAWVRGLGFAFAPLGVDMQVWLAANARFLSGNPVLIIRGLGRYFSEQLPPQFQRLSELAAGCDAIVFAGIAFAAPSVAGRLGVPVFGLSYSPGVLPGRAHPPPMIPWQRFPKWLNALLWRATNFANSLLVTKPLNDGRRSIGLPPVVAVEHLYRSFPFVVTSDPLVFPPDPAWGGRHPFVNFLFYEDPGVLDPELVKWLDAGDPPVFVGFGSMSGDQTKRVGELLREAIVPTRRRCLVSAGWAGLGAGELPDGWRVVKEAPHFQLFPRTALVVHHGGAGTTANVLRAGVPQVVLPLILDQFHHAHRLHEAGLAPKPVPMEKITAPQLRQAIEAAIDLPPAPRQVVADRLRASDGAGDLVTMLEERVAARKRPS